jgi:DNA-binding NarL/FixJ family response regulator
MHNGKRKLFVIEDNRTEGMLFRLALGSIPNLEIQHFATGRELLNNLKHQPDIVLVDLMLPDIPGFDLIREIRTYYPDVRIIVVSAQRDIDLIAKIQEQGVYNYLIKSESCLSYLQEVVRDLLIVLDCKNAQIQ